MYHYKIKIWFSETMTLAYAYTDLYLLKIECDKKEDKNPYKFIRDITPHLFGNYVFLASQHFCRLGLDKLKLIVSMDFFQTLS